MRFIILLVTVAISLIISLVSSCEYTVTSHDILSDKTNVDLDIKYQYPTGLELTVNRNGMEIQKIRASDNLGATVESFSSAKGVTLSGWGKEVFFGMEKNDADYAEFRVVRSLKKGQLANDCFNFGKDVYWYGGPQSKNQQYWPLNGQHFTDFAYITKELESTAITERYWLNSLGVFIYIEEEAPLFITQRPDQELCFTAKKELPYNTAGNDFTFAYRIGVAANPKIAHLKAVNLFLGKPTDVPDERMVQHPIWSTWAKYKTEIDETIVKKFAEEIKTNGFENSQFEIDDDWETCYGSLTINETKFPDMKALTDSLKNDGYRVTLWIHPFINKGCEPIYSEALEKGYLVKNTRGSVDTKWWNTKKENEWAAYIDFTNQAAADWFTERLQKLQEIGGFDSFKFDAGETSWAPQPPVLQGKKELHPGWLTTAYINTVQKFGSMVEVRAGQGNQKMPIFMRMIDKDTYWGYNNGLVSLVTTLLQLNMAGYPFVLPDMIGGNGYDSEVTKELFIRWLQANVFMPSLQYSYVPWDFDEETVELSKKFNKLHADHTQEIMEAMKQATVDGTPVNKPIWWIAPTDPIALRTFDEFLLGDKILAAPVLEEGKTTRDIYLPAGSWKDGNSEEILTGGRTIKDYPAPLDVLPYFIKQ